MRKRKQIGTNGCLTGLKGIAVYSKLDHPYGKMYSVFFPISVGSEPPWIYIDFMMYALQT